MNLPENDDERELILSQYIDGELDPASSAELEACLIENPKLRAELSEIKTADAAASRTVKRYHRDERMSKAVAARLKVKKSAHGLPVSSRPSPRSRSRRMRQSQLGFFGFASRAAALVLVCAGAYYGWTVYHQPQPVASATPPTIEPKPTNSIPSVVVAPAVKTPAITEDVREITCADGTHIWARKGSRVETINSRSVHLEGEALFHVAKGETPFVVVTDAGQALALGTRFDVKTGNGHRVRVAEGHVRVEAAGKTVDALGGSEVNSEMTLSSFDPRALMAEWNAFGAANVLTDMVPAWTQSGGNAGRTGMSPLSGPQALVARPEMFFAFPDEQPAVGTALVDSTGNVVVLRRTRDAKRSCTLWSLHLADGRAAAWNKLSDGLTDIAPAISPEGWVIGATETGAAAFDASGKAMWTLKSDAAPRGLCITASTLLVAEDAAVSAWSTRDGKQLWKCAVNADLSGVVTVNAAGQICAVAGQRLVVIDPSGVAQHTFSWHHEFSQAPIAADGNNVWLLDKDGRATRMNLSTGDAQDAAFKKAPLAAPLGSGLFGSGSALQRFDQSVAAKSPATDAVMALAQDGRGQVFVAYTSGVLRLQTQANGALKEMEFANIARGEVLPGGIAVAPGRAIVTTTLGVQVFE